MCRGHLRDAIAPRGDELYLGNHFLVDAIRVLPVVVPARERPLCCHLSSGSSGRIHCTACINLVKHLLTYAALRKGCKNACRWAYPEPKVLR